MKMLGREADHSHPSSAKVKDDRAIHPLLIRLHGVVLSSAVHILKLERLQLISSSNSSYIATDGQSASSSWCRAPFGAYDQILIFFF
jgi:hypothetical protein